MFNMINSDFHQYLLTCYGLNFKGDTFNSFQSAKQAMYEVCDQYCIRVTCTDDSRYSKLYQDDRRRVSFCISRI